MQNQSVGRPSDPAIACTLTVGDLQDRRQAWIKVGRFIIASGPIPGGLRFDFAMAGGVRESLIELVRLEAECCAWMSFTIEDMPERLRLAVTGVGPEGERGVRESFGSLLRG